MLVPISDRAKISEDLFSTSEKVLLPLIFYGISYFSASFPGYLGFLMLNDALIGHI